jgi:hypothetical protein
MIWSVCVVVPQGPITVSVTVSVPGLSAEYDEEKAPFPVPLPGEKEFPVELLNDQLVAFETLKLIVDEFPSSTVDGAAVNDEIPGAGVTVTLALPFVEHPAAAVTVTVTWTGPVGPAEKVMAFVPAPPVIVPFVMPHA